MNLLVLNLLMALAWMGFNADFSLGGFTAGFVLGHGVLWLGRPLYPNQRYFRLLWGSLGYFLWLLKEIVLSSLKVTASVLGFGEKVQPAVIAIPLDARTDLEITLLACSITLTPGTLTLDVAPDRKHLYIHAMFGGDAAALCAETKDSMERRILQVLR